MLILCLILTIIIILTLVWRLEENTQKLNCLIMTCLANTNNRNGVKNLNDNRRNDDNI